MYRYVGTALGGFFPRFVPTAELLVCGAALGCGSKVEWWYFLDICWYLALPILRYRNRVIRVVQGVVDEGGSNPGNGGWSGFATGGTRSLEDIIRAQSTTLGR